MKVTVNYNGRTEMPYEMVVELLELVKKYEQKSEA